MTSLYVYRSLMGQKMEPDSLSWISVSWLEVSDRIQYKEHYVEDICSSSYQYMNDYFSKLCRDVMNYKNNSIVIMKSHYIDGLTGYIVRRGNSTYNDNQFKKSSTRFLSIEYSHPKMTSSIELNLENTWFISGNEIFNITFLLRVLEYQSNTYFFDNEYTLKIMDDHCNIFTVRKNDYILLLDDGYEIVSINE